MTIATVELSRNDAGNHIMSIHAPNRQLFHLNLDGVTGAVVLIQWADYNMNRPATPIEELVDAYGSSVEEETINRSVYSHAQSTVKEDKGKLLAAITHIQANHAEMVARNKVLRDRPDLRLCDALDREALLRSALKYEIGKRKPSALAQKALGTMPPHVPTLSCEHPARCLGQVHEEDESEEPHCLWCGDIADLAMLVKHCSTIYSYVTDGRITKPNTLPEEVQRVADDLETERTQAALADALEDEDGATADGAGVPADGAQRLDVDELYARELKLLQHLNLLGVIDIQRGRLATEIHLAYKAMDNAA